MDTLADVPHSTLSGVARVLVHAGRLSAKTAEDLVKGAKDKKTSFVAAVIAAGAVSPSDLAHTLAGALALPLLDLNAVDTTNLNANFDQTSQRAIGGSGNLNLEYKGRYIFDGALRRDGSSLFGTDQRWHNYYRTSFAWARRPLAEADLG